MTTLIHEFDSFSVLRSIGGDYFIETDQGDEILILSPSGSDEHEKMAEWIEDPTRTESDFQGDIDEYNQENPPPNKEKTT